MRGRRWAAPPCMAPLEPERRLRRRNVAHPSRRFGRPRAYNPQTTRAAFPPFLSLHFCEPSPTLPRMARPGRSVDCGDVTGHALLSPAVWASLRGRLAQTTRAAFLSIFLPHTHAPRFVSLVLSLLVSLLFVSAPASRFFSWPSPRDGIGRVAKQATSDGAAVHVEGDGRCHARRRHGMRVRSGGGATGPSPTITGLSGRETVITATG